MSDGGPTVLVSHESSLSSGAPRVLANVAVGLAGMGREIVVVAPERTGLLQVVAAAGIDTVALSEPGHAGILQVIRRIRPRLVHVNTLIGARAAMASSALRIPVVWHVHEHEMHFRRFGGLRLRTARHTAACFIAISNYVRDGLVASGVDPGDITVALNGIDAAAFVEGAQNGPSSEGDGGTPLVGMVGALTPLKGVDRFVDIARRAGEVNPGLRFMVVGNTAPRHFKGFAAAVRRDAAYTLGDRLEFTGARLDAAALMARFEVLLIPSRAEPFGLVALEAMALGKPVLGFRGGGLPEVVVDGVTGRLSADGDTAAAAEQLLGLMADSELRKRMGEAGQARAFSEFTVANMVSAVAAAHDAALHTAGESRGWKKTGAGRR